MGVLKSLSKLKEKVTPNSRPNTGEENVENLVTENSELVQQEVGNVMIPESAMATVTRAQDANIAYLTDPGETEMSPKLIDLNELANKQSAEIIKLKTTLKKKALKISANTENAKVIAENADALQKARELNRDRLVKGVKAACEMGVTTVKAGGAIVKGLVMNIGRIVLNSISAIADFNDERASKKGITKLY